MAGISCLKQGLNSLMEMSGDSDEFSQRVVANCNDITLNIEIEDADLLRKNWVDFYNTVLLNFLNEKMEEKTDLEDEIKKLKRKITNDKKLSKKMDQDQEAIDD